MAAGVMAAEVEESEESGKMVNNSNVKFVSSNNKTAKGRSCSKCEKSDDKHMILCADCGEWSHFMCTKLWSYQIHMFNSTNRKFSCSNCVTTPKDLHLVCFDKEYNDLKALYELASQDKDSLEGKLKCLESEISVLRDQNVVKANEFKSKITEIQNSKGDKLSQELEKAKATITRLERQLTESNRKNAELIREAKRNIQYPNSASSSPSIDMQVQRSENQETSSYNERKLRTELKKVNDELAATKIEIEKQASQSSFLQINLDLSQKLINAKDDVIKVLKKHSENVTAVTATQVTNHHIAPQYPPNRRRINTKKVCFAYQNGNYNKNQQCQFHHPIILCKFFETPAGYKRGTRCRFSHQRTNAMNTPSSNNNQQRLNVNLSNSMEATNSFLEKLNTNMNHLTQQSQQKIYHPPHPPPTHPSSQYQTQTQMNKPPSWTAPQQFQNPTRLVFPPMTNIRPQYYHPNFPLPNPNLSIGQLDGGK